MNYASRLPFPWRRVIPLAGAGLLVIAGGCSSPPPHRPATPAPVAAPPIVMPPATPAPVVARPVQARPVILIQATSSAPVEADRAFAEKLTKRMGDWLKEAGIPVKVMTDDQFSRSAGAGARVAILPYNPTPGAPQLHALKRFLGSGGKLIVFHGAEPQLAALMGLKLGGPKTTTGTDSWNIFEFQEGAPPGTPMRIEQTSRTIMPAYPAEPGSRVIAWWQSLPGRDTRDPACTKSSRGFWISHVLLESDVALKQQMLASLLGACDRDLWQAAAAQSVNQAGTLDRFRSAREAMAAIRSDAQRGGQEAAVLRLLERAETVQQDLAKLYRQENYPRIPATARELDSLLTEAIARTQPPRPGEFRGLWNHSGTGFTPGKWEDTCRTLVHSGLTAIFPNVQKPWAADYPSKLIPPSNSLTRYGDQVQACLDAAQKHGLDVHAWVILWSLEGAPDSLLAPYRRENRLQVTSSGRTLSWLCPSHPANRAFERAAIHELAARYHKLAGIQLDYIRYQSSDTCYCNGCRSRFTEATGIRSARWPADVRSGPQAAAYRDWRRAQITGFVSEIRQDLRRLNPNLKLSASVYPLYPGVRDSIGQDWGEWLRLGLLDFACPMSYTADTTQYANWYRKQVAHPGVRGKLFPGIGVTSSECRLNAVETMEEINVLRREGAGGFTLFDANPTMEKEILPYLRLGLTAP